MTASIYVIRESKVRGQGRYWSDAHGNHGWVQSRDDAAKFGSDAPGDPAQETREWIEERSIGGVGVFDATRIVRVVRKHRDVVSVDHHMASVAMAREAALEEAERVARDPNVPLTGIADAIAAIRVSE